MKRCLKRDHVQINIMKDTGVMFTQKLRMRTEFKEAECAGLVSLHTRTWRWGDRVLLCLRSNESFYRCCLDLYGPDLPTPAGIF